MQSRIQILLLLLSSVLPMTSFAADDDKPAKESRFLYQVTVFACRMFTERFEAGESDYSSHEEAMSAAFHAVRDMDKDWAHCWIVPTEFTLPTKPSKTQKFDFYWNQASNAAATAMTSTRRSSYFGAANLEKASALWNQKYDATYAEAQKEKSLLSFDQALTSLKASSRDVCPDAAIHTACDPRRRRESSCDDGGFYSQEACTFRQTFKYRLQHDRRSFKSARREAIRALYKHILQLKRHEWLDSRDHRNWFTQKAYQVHPFSVETDVMESVRKLFKDIPWERQGPLSVIKVHHAWMRELLAHFAKKAVLHDKLSKQTREQFLQEIDQTLELFKSKFTPFDFSEQASGLPILEGLVPRGVIQIMAEYCAPKYVSLFDVLPPETLNPGEILSEQHATLALFAIPHAVLKYVYPEEFPVEEHATPPKKDPQEKREGKRPVVNKTVATLKSKATDVLRSMQFPR